MDNIRIDVTPIGDSDNSSAPSLTFTVSGDGSMVTLDLANPYRAIKLSAADLKRVILVAELAKDSRREGS